LDFKQTYLYKLHWTPVAVGLYHWHACLDRKSDVERSYSLDALLDILLAFYYTRPDEQRCRGQQHIYFYPYL